MMPEHDETYFCPRCQFGRCRPSLATYTRLYHGMMLSAPDTRVYICDVCGYQEFSEQALDTMRDLLGADDAHYDDSPRLPKTRPIDPPEINESNRPKP